MSRRPNEEIEGDVLALTCDASSSSGDDGPAENGRWTKREHELFLRGMHIHGREWKKVQLRVHSMNTHSSTQICERAGVD